MKVRSPLQLYKLLPGTNCKECGEQTCMAFATKLLERAVSPEKCEPLRKERKKYVELLDVISPQIKEIVIGKEKAVKIGGEEVVHRHQLTYFNPTALFYDVWDTLPDDELISRVERIQSFRKIYVGRELTLDGIAIRCVSGDPERFASKVRRVMEKSELPLILCSLDPEILESGCREAYGRRPLIYAATEKNWKEVLKIARRYKLPVVISSPDLDFLCSLSKTFLKNGVSDLVLDPGTFPDGGLERTFESFIKLRRMGIEGQENLRFPLLATPITAFLSGDGIKESIVASLCMIKYADIMILHSLEPYSVLPVLTLRANLYTDPRRPVSVEPGVRKIGEPDESSPLLVTTNFALTYYTVESDIIAGGINCYLLVVDTGGLGVEVSVAGGQFKPQLIKDGLDSQELRRLKHKKIVLPGLAARLSGETEDITGWEVKVGPVDSAQIPSWMKDNW